jgi:phenylalanine-4-hydroxylase|tara:strand:+ start:170 stop:385 length:216 start_codon:yes stop_codon:yes gene_type:complete
MSKDIEETLGRLTEESRKFWTTLIQSRRNLTYHRNRYHDTIGKMELEDEKLKKALARYHEKMKREIYGRNS